MPVYYSSITEHVENAKYRSEHTIKLLSGGQPMGPDDFYDQDFILTVYTVAEDIFIIYTNVFKTIRVCRSIKG